MSSDSANCHQRRNSSKPWQGGDGKRGEVGACGRWSKCDEARFGDFRPIRGSGANKPRHTAGHLPFLPHKINGSRHQFGYFLPVYCHFDHTFDTTHGVKMTQLVATNDRKRL